MSRITAVAWLLAASVALSSCGSDTSQYQPLPASAPDGLSYPDPNMFTQGVAITPLLPTLATGTPTNYMVVPDLPAGLKLGADGRITGTPTEPKSPATYLVTAGNATGTTSFGVRITVIGRFTIGGNVSGLTGTGLVLTNNGGDNLAITANGSFVFSRGLAAGSLYSVAVATQPTGQTCSVSDGSGALTNDNFGRVAVDCSANTPKAGLFGSTWGKAVGSPRDFAYLDCSAPRPELVQGYFFDGGTGDLRRLRELITQLDARDELAGDAVPTNCGRFSAKVDADGIWMYVTNAETGTTSVYALEPRL